MKASLKRVDFVVPTSVGGQVFNSLTEKSHVGKMTEYSLELDGNIVTVTDKGAKRVFLVPIAAIRSMEVK